MTEFPGSNRASHSWGRGQLSASSASARFSLICSLRLVWAFLVGKTGSRHVFSGHSQRQERPKQLAGAAQVRVWRGVGLRGPCGRRRHPQRLTSRQSRGPGYGIRRRGRVQWCNRSRRRGEERRTGNSVRPTPPSSPKQAEPSGLTKQGSPSSRERSTTSSRRP